MAFGFVKKVLKVVLRAVLGEVLNAEKLFGAGRGEEKLEAAASGVRSALVDVLDSDKVVEIFDFIISLINSVVEVLNSLGLLDKDPGLDIDWNRLVPAVKGVFEAVAELVDAIVE